MLNNNDIKTSVDQKPDQTAKTSLKQPIGNQDWHFTTLPFVACSTKKWWVNSVVCRLLDWRANYNFCVIIQFYVLSIICKRSKTDVRMHMGLFIQNKECTTSYFKQFTPTNIFYLYLAFSIRNHYSLLLGRMSSHWLAHVQSSSPLNYFRVPVLYARSEMEVSPLLYYTVCNTTA